MSLFFAAVLTVLAVPHSDDVPASITCGEPTVAALELFARDAPACDGQMYGPALGEHPKIQAAVVPVHCSRQTDDDNTLWLCRASEAGSAALIAQVFKGGYRGLPATYASISLLLDEGGREPVADYLPCTLSPGVESDTP